MNVDDKMKNYILDLIDSNEIITNNISPEFFVDVLGFMYDKSDELYDEVVDFSDLCDLGIDEVYYNFEYSNNDWNHDNVDALGYKNNLNNITFWAMLYIGFCNEGGLYYDFASLTFDDYTTRYYLSDKGCMEDYFNNNPRLFVNKNNSSNNTIAKVRNAKFKMIIEN